MIRTETIARGGSRIALVLLDRPEKRNALTPEMMASLGSTCESAAAAHDAIVLAGEGRLFCTGFDLSLCKATPDGSAMRALLTGLSRVCSALRRSPKPVVVAAHGAAIAGGCALLGGADVVVSDPEARLGYPVTRIGVSPAVSAPFLALNVTCGVAREMLLLPELLTGEEAHARGLVHELAPSREAVRTRAIDIAATLAEKPAHALAATKDWLNRLEGSDSDGMIRLALEASLALAGGPEERAMLAALEL